MSLKEICDALNSNNGVLDLILFLTTLFLGWISGLFKSLIKRPRFKIRIIPKMTFGSAFFTGEKYTPEGQGTYDLNKVAFAVYLEITNVGTIPASLGKIEVSYLKSEIPKWWHKFHRKRVSVKESNILERFLIQAGDKQIILPYLRQSDYELSEIYDGFLEVGKSKIGVAYFEQPPSWGNYYPEVDDEGNTKIYLTIKDAFGNKYTQKANIPMIPLDQAHKYNPSFGFTEIIIAQSASQNPNELKVEVEVEDQNNIKD